MMARAWCKHYMGMHRKDSCEAGIRFDSLPGHGKPGFMDACPCFGPSSGCDRAEYPTPEEIAEEEAQRNKRLNAIGNARKAIVESLGGPWKRGMSGSTGVIDCPACGSKDSLRFSRSGYNGHIHAHCKTDDCVSWME